MYIRKSMVVVTFLTILEMAKETCALTITQEDRRRGLYCEVQYE